MGVKIWVVIVVMIAVVVGDCLNMWKVKNEFHKQKYKECETRPSPGPIFVESDV